MEILVAEQLRKSFPSRSGPVEAVRGVDLRVLAGEVFGFLSPNGAGKTTTLRMLATLLSIDAGTATVAGADVRRRPQQVRRRIGYVGQAGGADLPATGRENLLLQGRLYGMSAAEARSRAAQLMDALALGEFVDRPAATYSGGQRRRLELAVGLMHHPQLLFLDEPTTGLDPHNRANLWDLVRALRDDSLAAVVTGLQLPLTLLSGILLPLSLAPGWLRGLAHLDPLYYAVQASRDLSRGVVANGTVATGALVMVALTALTLTWATRTYRAAIT